MTDPCRKVPTLAVTGVLFTVLLCSAASSLWADVIINVLAVNGTETSQEKDISFSLPGEIKPEDVLDAAGLEIDYDVKNAGYFLHGKYRLEPKETKTLKVKVRDVWRLSDDQVKALRAEIDQGFNEMGAEKPGDNGQILKDRLTQKLDYVLNEEAQSTGSIDQRIDTYRSHLQTIRDIQTKTRLIDYWRSDAKEEENNKVISYMIEVENPTDKLKKVKQQHVLPPEVRPEYIVDRQGYEIRFDEKKGNPFLFKEEDLAAKEKKSVKIGIKDVWFIPAKETVYLRERTKGIFNTLLNSKFFETAKQLNNDIVNNLDLIEALQAQQQPDIKQHIGAYRIDQKRFEQAKSDLDALEKLLARFRADLEKSKIKNVMQKIQALQSLSRISQAVFDKKPAVNTAWKLIGIVMLFLALFTIIHFALWFVRTAKEKKPEEMALPKEEKKEDNEH